MDGLSLFVGFLAGAITVYLLEAKCRAARIDPADHASLWVEKHRLEKELAEARKNSDDGSDVPAMWRGEIDERGRPLRGT